MFSIHFSVSSSSYPRRINPFLTSPHEVHSLDAFTRLDNLMDILLSMFSQEEEIRPSPIYKGATKQELKKIPIIFPTKELLAETCAICQEKFRLRSKIMKLNCKHYFCQGCISKWFENSINCPTCRKSIREKSKS